MPRIFSVLIFLFSLSAIAASPSPPPLEHFARASEFIDMQISPDGEHLAVKMNYEGKTILGFMRTDKFELINVLNFAGNAQVGHYQWVNDERVVVGIEYFKAWFDFPVDYGELFAVNLDGSKPRNIYGYKASGRQQTGTHIKQAGPKRAWAKVLDPLPEDEKHILIKSTPMSSQGDGIQTVYRLNVYSGRTKKIVGSPVRRAYFLTDHDGKVRFVKGRSDDGNIKLYYRSSEDKDWNLINETDSGDGDVSPLAFAEKADEVYLLDNSDNDLYGLYRQNMKTGKRELVYRDETVDPLDYWFSADGRRLFALNIEPGYPSYVFVDKQSPEAKRLKGLLQAFGGEQVSVISQTPDGSKAIVLAYSDRNPGAFYLYDKPKGQVSYLAERRSWIDPDSAATTEPITFQARDGRTIHGYLTLPAGDNNGKLPLVVVPHGGPHGIRDYWDYDSEAQMLASRGLAVLKVNYRGSKGYGREFAVSGYRSWGEEVQYDIIDGTRHVIEQGIADEKRVCIYGGSFGGYSALQSSVLAPDLFQCSIGFAGVYDLELMYQVGDIPKSKSGVRYLKKVIGEDEQKMRAFSPLHNVDKLKAPVLIIHGGEDERVPIDHAEQLREALEAKSHPYEWLEMADEGHGFYKDEHRLKAYRKMLAFLETHLKL